MTDLNGFRVLVVEDEMLVSMLVEDMLTEMGCVVVGPAASLSEAEALVGQGGIDAAVLDVNVAGRPIFPVADRLKAMGVPFVFASGYGEAGLSDDHRDAPVLQKPFRDTDLEKAVRALKQNSA
ncbi:MAG: response regulator [Caulobacteraceae bacterium]|nr:response regulator [Caulobacteraceae bacterium]